MTVHIARQAKAARSVEPAQETDRSQQRSPSDYRRELRVTMAALAFSLAAWLMATWETGEILWRRIEHGSFGLVFEQAVFVLIIQALFYGGFVYQFTRLGYLLRRLAHARLPAQELECIYDGNAPSLTILVPSYREEIAVVRRTLISAMLQDFPGRRIVLLIDDPPRPADPADARALLAMRRLLGELKEMFEAAAKPIMRAQKEFEARTRAGNIDLARELVRLAALYDDAARWVEAQAASWPVADHGDALLLDKVLHPAGRRHRDRAQELRSLSGTGSATFERVQREYNRLAALFSAELTSFERKRYANLSHQPNKAMNLNSYIRLLGRSWREVAHFDGVYLEPASPETAILDVPAADFLITLDADSVLVPEYAMVLVNEMLRPGNERVAVAQTPYNTIPNPPRELERVAGATTDIQYLIHQGFTHYGGTYWVGANALLRTAALQDIREEVEERGFRMPVFIQDRTVIEDTESSVDLVARGWSLYNYPERLAFSATPPDFGSLLIQRRRWANGGLLILPKLARYLVARPRRFSKIVEGFFRAHYLLSLAAVNVGVLIVLGHSFESSLETAWVPVAGLPYFFLYARDLRYSGYRLSDCLRVYALNLLLIPVNLGGVLKSVHQGITGQRTPFGRTPKVNGRTGAPALYVLAEYGMLAWWLGGCAMAVADEHWRSAIFAFANSVALAYAIRRYMGERESWEDIRTGLSRWVNPGTQVLEPPALPTVSPTHTAFGFTVLAPAPHGLVSEPVPEITKMAERESWPVAGARLWPTSARARNNGVSTASRSRPPDRAHTHHVV